MPAKTIFVQGDKFPDTRLTYQYEVPKITKGRRRAVFLCDCGVFKEINIVHVVNKKTMSCGCLLSETSKEIHTKHGNAPRGNPSGAYRSWIAMHQRVKSAPLYANISICERWYSFENFLNDMGKRPKGHTIERINNAGNYEPSNCIWADNFIQASNRSTNRYVTIDGETKTVSQWCRIYKISLYTVSTRMRNGMGEILAITTPVRIPSQRTKEKSNV